MSQLDLIKAPLAWNITQGSPNIYAGIIERYVDLDHEDLENQIQQFIGSISTGTHGTLVSGVLAAQKGSNYCIFYKKGTLFYAHTLKNIFQKN